MQSWPFGNCRDISVLYGGAHSGLFGITLYESSWKTETLRKTEHEINFEKTSWEAVYGRETAAY